MRPSYDLSQSNQKQEAAKHQLAMSTAKVTMLKYENGFIFRVHIILVCEGYARTRIAPVNIPHARKKRGQKNQSNSRPRLRF